MTPPLFSIKHLQLYDIAVYVSFGLIFFSVGKCLWQRYRNSKKQKMTAVRYLSDCDHEHIPSSAYNAMVPEIPFE